MLYHSRAAMLGFAQRVVANAFARYDSVDKRYIRLCYSSNARENCFAVPWLSNFRVSACPKHDALCSPGGP